MKKVRDRELVYIIDDDFEEVPVYKHYNKYYIRYKHKSKVHREITYKKETYSEVTFVISPFGNQLGEVWYLIW